MRQNTYTSSLDPSPTRAMNASVEYFAKTPLGSETRFQLRIGLEQMRGAQSETAVLGYLRQRHPQCEITIASLKFE
jgi:hypothetical protein